MNKRHFLTTTMLGGAALAPAARAQGTPQARSGSPTLLTVTGAIGKGNRGGVDAELDQMMVKQKITFDKAHAFDFAALTALPAVTIKPTLEYGNKVRTLTGPLLADVLKAAGASPPEGARLTMRAIDGYSPTLTVADMRKYRFIVATHLDGRTMPLGGLGPLWAVYEPDRFPEWAAKKVSERFAQCPWGMYHIDVPAA